MVQYGFARKTKDFDPVDRCVDFEKALEYYNNMLQKVIKEVDLQQKESDIPEELEMSMEYDVTDIDTPIKKWLPPKPIKKAMFGGKLAKL
jgi:hypothetical protein